MKFSPIKASEEITKKYKRYLRTIFEIADEEYSAQFKQELEAKESFAKGPYLDVVDSFKKGRTLKQLIESGLLPESFQECGFIMDRPLYLHQEEAIKRCAEGKNIVVSTGTGSGKTESFLIPILRELTLEDENGTLSSGVRALIIYPMNALANDQMERLREVLYNYPQITYGSYTGQTKNDYSKALQEYRMLNDGKSPLKNELISREQMIDNPPNILITNYAMLEYLMIRPKENSFFEGIYANHWKFIVLDEAHIYNGSTGIEVSMLLRRLKSSIPVKKLQYILTSATLGNENQNPEVAEFASRLCDSVFNENDVIRATRQQPEKMMEAILKRNISDYENLAKAIIEEDKDRISQEIVALGGKCLGNLHSDVYDLLLCDSNYWDIRVLLEKKPQTIYYLANAMGCENHHIENYVTVAAYAIKNNAQLFDAKYHMFIKACDSAFVTLGKSKKLMLTRNRQVFEHGLEYAVFEIAVCTFCHSVYLIGRVDAQGYFVQKSMNDSVDDKEILYLGNTISDEDDENSFEKMKLKVEEYKLCSRCGKLMPLNASSSEKCEHTNHDFIKVFRVQKKGKVLTKCVACENVNTKGILRQFFAGQEAVTSVLGTALFEELPSYKIMKEKIVMDQNEFSFDDEETEDTYIVKKEEESAKQFIAFSDSRQAAAFYASYLEKTYTTILYKRLIVEALRKTEFSGNLQQFAGVLQAEFENNHILTDEGMSAEKEAWKAILNEMVNNYSENALQNLGFYEMTVSKDLCPGMQKMDLSQTDVANLINIFIQSMMQDAAIAYPILLNQVDKEFFTYNGHEGGFTLSDSSKNKRCSSFLPSKSGRSNKRIDFVEKLFAIIVPDKTRDDARNFLESFWNLMIKKEIIINEGVEYKVNVKKIHLHSKVKFYRCPVCKKITPYNIKNICPTYKCNGILQEIDLKSALNDNHYYRMYQDMEIRSLRVVEHTAQLSKEKAYHYQNLFKEKKIDVLSCSTTFEMGVDVGSLETVFMRNMPPSPANYAQRAGRAGRSIKSVAYALTFCNKGNHDFMYFNQPESMIRGNVKPPVFKVENDKIGIRHVFASAFAFFWKKYPDYFSTVETLIEKKDGVSGLERLKEYLDTQPDNLKKFLIEFLPEELINKYDVEHFGWVLKLLEEKGALTRAVNDYTYEINILEKSLQEALISGGKVDYLRYRINNYKKESVLSFLSRKSILPKYGFPIDTVELAIWDSKSKNKLDLDLQRDLAMAISEYAPGSQIVADGNLITSHYIKKVPNMDWRRFDYIYCDCKTLNIEPHIEHRDEEHLQYCRVCGEKLSKDLMGTFIVPEFGFEAGKVEKAGLIRPQRTFNSEVAYVGYRNDIQYDHFKKGNREYEIAYSQNDEMAVLNQSNFYVCNTCGYAHLSSKGFRTIYPKEHRKLNGMKCENKNLHKYALGYRFETDVIQIRFCWPQITLYEQAVSILYGIMKGTCSYLSIEENDIAGCLRYFYNKATRSGNFMIILYDKTPGGAGHVKRLNNPHIFEKVLSETRRIVRGCTCGGAMMDTACYQCLKSYSNQRVHDILQRRYVLEFLDDFFDDNLSSIKTFETLTASNPQGMITVGVLQDEDKGFDFKFEQLLESFSSQLTEKRRFIGIMKDLLNDYPKQLNLMIALYKMNIHEEIEHIAEINDIFTYRFEKRMVDELGISKENAIWAVSTWCVTYGKILNKL
ncbi:hypothetical protein BHF70_02145 [Anaerostipes sp. 494a]|uniref:DEAD/DEAH box helicase n=1 Tax=Anaerostipes sp. 494a TaxID=1261636 RepID=UPI00095319ED|nr:DEAD/DEAH box helicase [Anaerostipes sp. 494a]OLR58524.1 hypothetical protein BHF70_02145 [Anaerostipes sp. 494a]